MTAARKLQTVSSPTASAADVEAELAAAQQALSAAATAVEAAQRALDESLHEPAVKRAVLREELHTARERLEDARKAVKPVYDRLNATQRRDDIKAFHAAVERVGHRAQTREAMADAEHFVNVIGGAVRALFERQSARNIQFHDEANELEAIWSRLGHDFRAPGVLLEPGTGTESIAPSVSLQPLRNFEHHVRNLLDKPHPQATPIEQATRQFLLGAISAARTASDLKLAMDANVTLRMQLPQSAAGKVSK